MLTGFRLMAGIALLFLVFSEFATADQRQLGGLRGAVNPHQLSGTAPGSVQADPPSSVFCLNCDFYQQREDEVKQDIQEVRREIENYRKWIEKLWREYNECVRTKPPETCSNIMNDIRSLEDRLAFLLERLSQLRKALEEIRFYKNWWCEQCER